MDLAEVLRRRKAVRNYLPEPIDREVLERIVARGRRAPSGGFSQGLRLLVVTDADTRRAIAALAEEDEYVKLGFEPWISRAPAPTSSSQSARRTTTTATASRTS